MADIQLDIHLHASPEFLKPHEREFFAGLTMDERIKLEAEFLRLLAPLLRKLMDARAATHGEYGGEGRIGAPTIRVEPYSLAHIDAEVMERVLRGHLGPPPNFMRFRMEDHPTPVAPAKPPTHGTRKKIRKAVRAVLAAPRMRGQGKTTRKQWRKAFKKTARPKAKRGKR